MLMISLILGKFRDGLLAGQVADFVDRAHHLTVDGIVQDLFDEAAVDLQDNRPGSASSSRTRTDPVPKSSSANLQPSSLSA